MTHVERVVWMLLAFLESSDVGEKEGARRHPSDPATPLAESISPRP